MRNLACILRRAAALSIALFAVTVRSAPLPDVRVIGLPTRPPSSPATAQVDWEEVRERTRRFQDRAVLENALSSRVLFSSVDVRAVEELHRRLGEPSGFLARLSFPQVDVQEAGAVLLAFADAVERDRAAADAWLAAISAGSDPDSAARGKVLAIQRRVLASRAAEVRALALAAADAFRLQKGGFFSRVRLRGRHVFRRDGATLVARLCDRLHRWGALQGSPVLGAELTYVEGAQRPGALPSNSIAPAYQAAGSAVLSLEDTLQGSEVELTDQIRAKAQELGSARGAYDFVKNEVRLDWYFGSLKGSGETLRERRGNDVDLAALLIALLRAQGTPARYVRGTIELSPGRIAELMGLLTVDEGNALHGGAGLDLDPIRRQQVLSVLAAAGVPHEPVITGGRVTSVRLLHTWVEAHLPYGSYRGIGAGPGGAQWVPMDPAISGAAKYAARPAAIDLLGEMGADASQLVNAYLREGEPGQSPLAFVRARAESWLSASGPAGMTYAQALRSVAARQEPLPFIPGSLPYAVPAVHEEYALLPDAAKQRMHLRVESGSGTLLDVTVPMHAVVGKRTVLAFEPATDEDALAVALAGGLYRVDAASVSVVPVLRVAGEPVGRASRALGLGERARWTIELLMPNGSSRTIANEVVAGNLIAIGFGGPVNGYSTALDGEAGADGEAARVLYRIAAEFANSWTAGEEELAALLGVVPLRPTANLVLVENQLEVDQALGIRRRLIWKGLQVDADHRSMTPLELAPGRGRELLRLSGFEGSFQEARVLREATGEDAVSAVTVIQEAHREGIPVLNITPASAASELPNLSTSETVRQEIEDQLARGREVIVPSVDLTIRDWSGTGFIARDPSTDEGGYFLSGVISGGQTIVSPGSWRDQELVERLQSPTRQEPETDSSLAARIVKASPGIQRGIVGSSHEIAVYVTTANGKPVEGAWVLFQVHAPSEGTLASLMAPGGSSELSVRTDRYGLAKVTVTPDRAIGHVSILERGSPHDVLVGYNEVMASVDNGANRVALATPFVVLADNDVPAEIRLASQIENAVYPAALQIGQDLWAFVLDRHGNAVPNTVLVWSTSPLAGVYLDFDELPDRAPRVLDASDPAQHPELPLVTSTDGGVVASFIPFPVVPGATGTTYLRADVGALSASYRIRVENPTAEQDKYVLYIKRQHLWSDDGVFRTDFPEPVGGQVLRWNEEGGRLWEALTGDEPGINRVVVRMETVDLYNPDAPITIRTEEIEPRQRTLKWAPWNAFDDEKTAAFWPRSEVNGGLQHNYLTFEVERSDGVRIQSDRRWRIESWSLRPEIERFRLLPGFEERATDEFGSVSSDDLAAVFHVTNPAGYPIYARITSEPIIVAEELVVLPPPDEIARHPEDPELIVIPPHRTRDLRLAIIPGSHGGKVRLEINVPNPKLGPTAVHSLVLWDATIHISPPGARLVGGDSPLVAQVIFPVRNFAATATPADGKVYPDDADLPILRDAMLDFRVKGEGRATVSAGGNVVAAADIIADDDGTLLAMAPVAGIAPLQLSPTYGLRAPIPPAPPTVNEVVVSFQPRVEGDVQTWSVPFRTEYKDMGPLPIGHTFVRDVSVVDGHLVKQSVDVAVPGRGVGLTFQRSYTNRSFEDTVMGVGWTHSYRSFVMRDLSMGKIRYVVVGGEGSGQVFDCTAYLPDTTPCSNQRGFHGRLELTEAEIVYSAPNGVKYRYGRLETGTEGVRWWLTAVVDPRGNTTTLLYAEGGAGEGEPGDGDEPGTVFSGELARVYEPGNRRALQLGYEWPAGAMRPRLSKVELMAADGSAPDLAKPLAPIDEAGVCVAYDHDATGNLTAARRYDGACNPEAPALREELYAYLDSPLEVSRNNLVAYTDPNGNTTRYAYYATGDRFQGEGQFLLMGDKAERIRSVTEPDPGGTTSFSYVLVPTSTQVFGSPQLLYRTIVSGPRSGMPATTYYLDPSGASSRVERPISAGVFAMSDTVWDPIHLRPVEEIDARGRRTTSTYDERGNLVSRVTFTPSLADPGGKARTGPLTDADGNVVDRVAEKWSYDPDWSAESCHLDAEGRLTTTEYELGLPVVRRVYATALGAAAVRTEASCEALAQLAQPSSGDHVQTFSYCGVNAPCAATGSMPGDLVETTEGPRRTMVRAYDALGFPRSTSTVISGSATLDRTLVHDERGRLTSESDSQGHLTTRVFDGLDRPTRVTRANRTGVSPGTEQTFSYFPGGQPQEERLGNPGFPGSEWTRVWTINGLNRPAMEVLSGKNTTAVVTTTGYDQEGNVVWVTDGRGVRRETTYDEGERPRSVRLSLADRARFESQGGDPAGFESGHVIATFEHDAAGNKVAETDVHGHRTQYELDPLYRVVGVTQGGVRNDVQQRSEYRTTRRYDLVGNKVRETDADGHETRWTYDHEDRILEVVDPVGRFERRTYDALGQAVREEFGAGTTVRLTRTSKGHDGLGRTLGITEQFATVGAPTGAPPVPNTGSTYEVDVAYDDAKHLVATRDRRGYVTVQQLDDVDRVYREMADASGTLLARQGDPRVGPALNLTTEYEYDASGNRVAVVDAEGRRTETTFDALKRVRALRSPMGYEEHASYDAAGNVVERVDARGIRWWSTFDALGRPTSEHVEDRLSTGAPDLRIASRTYYDSPEGTRILETDARANSVIRHTDGLHREYRAEKGTAVVETWFDADEIRRKRDPKGYVTEIERDAAGRVTAQRELDLGGQVVFEQSVDYDDATGTRTAYDRRGTPTTSILDGLGRVERVTSGVAGAGDTSLVRTDATLHDGAGNAVVLVDPNGHATERVYDGAGRRIREVRAVGSPAAATTAYTYDRVSNVIEQKGPRATGRPFDVRVSYDDLNRAVRAEDALGNVSSVAYDGAGNRICEKRPLGGDPLGFNGAKGRTGAQIEALVCAGSHVTRWSYDEASKLLSVRDAAGGEHSFVYDEARNLIGKQDANENLTTYAYDHLDRRTDEWQHLDVHARVRSRREILGRNQEGPPDPVNGAGALHWKWELDANGNPRTTTDPKGLVTTREYGVLNRLERESYDRPLLVAYPLLRSVAYEYDANGNPDLVTEEKETATGTVLEVTDKTYDVLDRLASELRYDGKLVQYRYDRKGNRKEVIDPDQVSTGYEYDAQDRLVTATTPEGVTAQRWWPDGLEQGRTLPNGVVEGRCYDAAGQLTQRVTARGAIGTDCTTSAAVVSRFTYQYDGNGNRSVQVEQRTMPGQALGAVEETRYGYDALDRLVGVRYGDGRVLLYRLDAVGNRTGERELVNQPAGVDLTSFTAADPSALVRDVTSAFNRADWLLTQTDAKDAAKNATFSWDLAGNLVSRAKAGQTRQLRWDPRNALIAAIENGSVVGSYDYDASGIRVKRRTSTEQVEYVLDEKYVLQEARGNVASHPSYRRYHYAYGPLSVTDAAGTRYIGTDALGSPTDLTTTTGTVVAAHQYDAWGQYRNGTAPSAEEPKLGYTGHQYDPETGLVYARARYYDPEIGIFISRDSYEGELEDGPSLHRFAYAYGNPLGYIDEDGNAAYEVADAWEKRQREGAWTAEQVMEQASANADQIGREAEAEFYRNHGNNEFMRFLVGLKVAGRMTMEQLAGGIAGTIVDPTVIVRAPMRIGTGAAEGVEDIREGRTGEGALKIVADVAGAVETGAGGLSIARGFVRPRAGVPDEAALSAARKRVARERIVQEVKAARATEQTARVPARGTGPEAPTVVRLFEKHRADFETLMAREQAGWPAGTARLAQRAANEPGFMVAMDRAPLRAPPSPARSAALGLGEGLEAFAPGRGVPWENWSGTLTRRSTSGRNFGRAFTDAMRNAESIQFNLTGMSDLSASFARGRAGFKYAFRDGEWIPTNATNTEFATVLRNPSLRNKTTFWRGGRRVRTTEVLNETLGE